MEICERDLMKATWDYLKTEEGEHYRFTELHGIPVMQKRVVFPENSRRRLSLKALQGQYELYDLSVKGTGNTFLVTGWETVPSLVKELEGLLTGL